MEVRDQHHSQLGGKLSRSQGLSGCFNEEKICCQRKHNVTATRKNHTNMQTTRKSHYKTDLWEKSKAKSTVHSQNNLRLGEFMVNISG